MAEKATGKKFQVDQLATQHEGNQYILKGVTKDFENKVTQAEQKGTQNAEAIQGINAKLSTVEQTANNAKSAAESAQQAATTADGKAGEAQTAATHASEAANAADSKAQQALGKATENEKAIQKLQASQAGGVVTVFGTDKDLTLPANKEHMEQGKQYITSFNKAGQHVKTNKNGVALEEQDPGVTDKVIDYRKISFLDEGGELVVLDVKLDFTGIAYYDKTNTFTEKQVLNIEQTLGAGANQIQDNHIPKYKTVKDYVSGEKFAKVEQANTFTQANTFNQPVNIAAAQNIENAGNNEAVKVQTLKSGFVRLQYKNSMPTEEEYKGGLNCYLVSSGVEITE